jgi:hypothetical protein
MIRALLKFWAVMILGVIPAVLATAFVVACIVSCVQTRPATDEFAQFKDAPAVSADIDISDLPAYVPPTPVVHVHKARRMAEHVEVIPSGFHRPGTTARYLGAPEMETITAMNSRLYGYTMQSLCQMPCASLQ